MVLGGRDFILGLEKFIGRINRFFGEAAEDPTNIDSLSAEISFPFRRTILFGPFFRKGTKIKVIR
jgi:hypothetical protein